jgi:hypothetical protein
MRFKFPVVPVVPGTSGVIADTMLSVMDTQREARRMWFQMFFEFRKMIPTWPITR